jgi:pyruvate kinase
MKQTKIVATISDQRCDVDFIRELYQAGMNVVRINTAHQAIEGSRTVINNIRKVSDKIAVLIDTKGPEIRTTVTRDPIEIETGEVYIFKGDADRPSFPGLICVNYANFVADLSVNDKILIDDGDLGFVVTEKRNDELVCKALNNGVLKSRKSVNIPGVEVSLPPLNEKDKEYIQFAIEEDIEFIAHSFVRSKEDVLAIKQILGLHQSKIKIIAKIENQEGVDNIEEILDHVYGVMVARGDLGVEIPAEKIPGVQRKLILACIKRKRPVIIATQMLHSMIEHPRPTRAEISDVANAVYSKTDALMLSGETAYGKYPVEAVSTMNRVALEVESNRPHTDIRISSIDNEIAAFLANVAVDASTHLNIKAVIVDSQTGRTARYLAAFRNNSPVYAACYNKKVVRELALSFGVIPFYMEPKKQTDAFKRSIMRHLSEIDGIEMDDRILLIGGSFGPRRGASFMEISLVRDLVTL